MYLIDIFGYVIELNLVFKFRLRKRRKGEKLKAQRGRGESPTPILLKEHCKNTNKMNNIQETPSKKSRGGARKGAGRPRTIAKQITIGIPQDALEIFQQQPNKNAFITEAIRHYAAFLAKEEG